MIDPPARIRGVAWRAQAPLPALRDPHVGRAIALVHQAPARDWTLATLAREVGLSRSVFAARFGRLVGEPAMRYVARWRMHVAVDWLREEGASVGELADRLGYRSEAAFGRAFKRFVGSPPGVVRRMADRRMDAAPVLAAGRKGTAEHRRRSAPAGGTNVGSRRRTAPARRGSPREESAMRGREPVDG